MHLVQSLKDTRTEGLGNKRTIRNHLNYSIIEINQNTEKSPGNLRRFAISQTLLRNHWLTLVWKIWKGVNNNKRICHSEDFAVLTDHKSENERKQNNRQIFGSGERADKTVEHEGDGVINSSRCPWNSCQSLGKEIGGIGNQS